MVASISHFLNVDGSPNREAIGIEIRSGKIKLHADMIQFGDRVFMMKPGQQHPWLTNPPTGCVVGTVKDYDMIYSLAKTTLSTREREEKSIAELHEKKGNYRKAAEEARIEKDKARAEKEQNLAEAAKARAEAEKARAEKEKAIAAGKKADATIAANNAIQSDLESQMAALQLKIAQRAAAKKAQKSAPGTPAPQAKPATATVQPPVASTAAAKVTTSNANISLKA